MNVNVPTAPAEVSAIGVHNWVRLIAWQHRYLVAIIIAYGGSALATASFHDNVPVQLLLGNIVLISAVGIAGIYGLAWFRPGWLARILPPDERNNGLPSQRLLHGLFTIVLFPLFFASFSAFKTMIPMISPFRWDGVFAAWDAALHGGIDPWRLLQPVLGHPVITVAVDWVYGFWFLVVFGTFLWQAFSFTNPERRMRFLLSFVLSWILIGSVAAILLSSAGPVYLALLTGEETGYADLLSYLQFVDSHYSILAIDAQEMLWNTYLSGEPQLGHGISAMPSMHVAAAVLTTLLAWRAGNPARIGTVLFVTAIFLGSIHLGWHYAIDGYFAAVMAFAIWKMTGILARHSLLSDR
ncbi:MAG: phosphatase PAP2 family protein [Alphaproteobacteria bacterium]|nr:phosphatase PAP2 family protein [Alphaproteobacteria bacterium]